MNNNRIPAESHAIQYTLLPVPVDFPFNSFSFSFLSFGERKSVAFDRTQDCLRLFHSIFERDRILNFKSALLACSTILHLNVKERRENEEMIV